MDRDCPVTMGPTSRAPWGESGHKRANEPAHLASAHAYITPEAGTCPESPRTCQLGGQPHPHPHTHHRTAAPEGRGRTESTVTSSKSANSVVFW